VLFFGADEKSIGKKKTKKCMTMTPQSTHEHAPEGIQLHVDILGVKKVSRGQK